MRQAERVRAGRRSTAGNREVCSTHETINLAGLLTWSRLRNDQLALGIRGVHSRTGIPRSRLSMKPEGIP